MLVADYLYKIVGDRSPTLLLEKTSDDRFFDKYMEHFKNVWESGKTEAYEFDKKTGELRWGPANDDVEGEVRG